MLGLEDYGSDVESGDERSPQVTTAATPQQTPAPSTSPPSKHPLPGSKSAFALPPPKSSSSSLSLPPPRSTSSSSATETGASAPPPKQRRTKKIAISLPSLPPTDDDADDDGPPAKKPRMTSTAGAGMSSLLSILPAPKQPATAAVNKKEGQERVLGGGSGPGLVFRTSRRDARRYDASGPAPTDATASHVIDAEAESAATPSAPSTSFLPPSLHKSRGNVSLETEGLSETSVPAPTPIALSTQSHLRTSAAPAVDFFSLSTTTPPSRSRSTPSVSSVPTVTSAPSAFTPSSAATGLTVSSAPAISTFRPPSPTPEDPYPGYYQLPSGAYAPYDTEYYASYCRRWQAEYDKHIRALEKAQYNAGESTDGGARDVDMGAEMEKAKREIKEREDRKALTAGRSAVDENGEPVMPRMNVQGAKLGAVARSRHQLTTLLTEAYLNRDALEEKIAQGRRNRKEAGNKYGF